MRFFTQLREGIFEARGQRFDSEYWRLRLARSRRDRRWLRCGAFRGANSTKTCGEFRDNPHAPTSETPRVQRRHLGAIIAVAYRSVVIQTSKSGGICYGESVPPGFFCPQSTHNTLQISDAYTTRQSLNRSKSPRFRRKSRPSLRSYCLKIGKAERELGPLLRRPTQWNAGCALV